MRKIPLDITCKYGSWSVLELVYHKNGSKYRCICDCGNESLITGTDLRKNKSQRCTACARKKAGQAVAKNLTNQQFGSWTVIKKIGVNKHRKYIWLCQCKCGRFGEIPSCNLLSGLSTKCGKCNHHQGIKGRVWTTIIHGAKTRKIQLTLTLKEAWELFLKQDGKCALTGVLLSLPTSCNEPYTASLDRIDNTKSYSVDNVQWVHKLVNRMKFVLNNEDFVSLCHQVVNKHNKDPKIKWDKTNYFKCYSKKNKNYNQGI